MAQKASLAQLRSIERARGVQEFPREAPWWGENPDAVLVSEDDGNSKEGQQIRVRGGRF